jgi:hypothetical protein
VLINSLSVGNDAPYFVKDSSLNTNMNWLQPQYVALSSKRSQRRMPTLTFTMPVNMLPLPVMATVYSRRLNVEHHPTARPITLPDIKVE